MPNITATFYIAAKPRIARMVGRSGGYPMRLALCFALLIMLFAAADAATVRRVRHPERHFRPERPLVPTPPKGFAVPGWTEEETRQWLDSASGPKG
jgi:hypothetical protein